LLFSLCVQGAVFKDSLSPITLVCLDNGEAITFSCESPLFFSTFLQFLRDFVESDHRLCSVLLGSFSFCAELRPSLSVKPPHLRFRIYIVPTWCATLDPATDQFPLRLLAFFFRRAQRFEILPWNDDRTPTDSLVCQSPLIYRRVSCGVFVFFLFPVVLVPQSSYSFSEWFWSFPWAFLGPYSFSF